MGAGIGARRYVLIAWLKAERSLRRLVSPLKFRRGFSALKYSEGAILLMSIYSVLITAGMLVIVALLLLAPITANLLAIIPRKWRLWMLGEPHCVKTSKLDDVVM